MTRPRRRQNLTPDEIGKVLGLPEAELVGISDPKILRLLGRAAVTAIALQKEVDFEKARADSYKSRMEQAEVDPLTGLLNREAFLEACGDMLAAQGYIVGMIDLRGIKGVNDTYGHQAGDNLLVGAARTLVQKGVRSGSAVGRWGGDEFVVMIPFDATKEVEVIMNRLHQLFSGEVETAEICKINDSTAVYLSGRMGYSVVDQVDEATVKDALALADAMLTEQAKKENNRGKLPNLAPVE